MKRFIKNLGLVVIFLAVAGIAGFLACNIHTVTAGDDYILEKSEFKDFDADYIMVLGCAVKPGGKPSDMLYDRMVTGTELYNMGAAATLLITGDSENPDDYYETSAMKEIALTEDVPEEALLIDTVGLSTYDSIKRAVAQLEGKKVVIVTQEYHLYRAVYIARKMGLDAYGCSADVREYAGQTWRTVREWVARTKDELYLILDFDSVYGTEISIEKYNVTVE